MQELIGKEKFLPDITNTTEFWIGPKDIRSELSLTLPSTVRPYVMPRTPAQKQCPGKNHASFAVMVFARS